jgi:hypothetical protein
MVLMLQVRWNERTTGYLHYRAYETSTLDPWKPEPDNLHL